MHKRKLHIKSVLNLLLGKAVESVFGYANPSFHFSRYFYA